MDYTIFQEQQILSIKNFIQSASMHTAKEHLQQASNHHLCLHKLAQTLRIHSTNSRALSVLPAYHVPHCLILIKHLGKDIYHSNNYQHRQCLPKSECWQGRKLEVQSSNRFWMTVNGKTDQFKHRADSRKNIPCVNA